MKMESDCPTLHEAVSKFYTLRVAPYQRTYAWTKEEIDELFLDLEGILDNHERHFFGTLILETRENSENKQREADIVDGQQRLTTLFIIICALRDELQKLSVEKIPKNDALGIKAIYPSQKIDALLFPTNLISSPRFIANSELREIMENCVIAEPNYKRVDGTNELELDSKGQLVVSRQPIPDRDSEISRVFRKAIRYIQSEIELRVNKSVKEGDHTPEVTKLKFINNMFDTLTQRFTVLLVLTSTQDESLDIFATLNNRGRPLGAGDLVRTQIMSQQSMLKKSNSEKTKLFNTVFRQWKDLADTVIEPETYLRHYLVATGDPKVTKKKVAKFAGERMHSKEPGEAAELAANLWKDILRMGDIYGSIVNPEDPYHSQQDLYMFLLEGLTKSHRIFLLQLLNSNLPENDEYEFVRLTFVHTFRWVISGGNAQQLEDFYQERTKQLRKKAKPSEIVKEFIDSANAREFNISKYLREEGDANFVGKALLYSANLLLADGAIAVPLTSEVHLEHIAPQTSTDHWVEKLGAADSESDDNSPYKQLICQIGNLTLLDGKLNSKVKQFPFMSDETNKKGEYIDKKFRYEKSNFIVTRDLLKISDWTPEVIELRNEWMVELFEIVFSIPASSSIPVDFTQWLTNNGHGDKVSAWHR